MSQRLRRSALRRGRSSTTTTKAAVLGDCNHGGIIYNRALIDLAGDYGFHPGACKLYRAKTRGKVERPFCYIREDFCLARTFHNLRDIALRRSVALLDHSNLMPLSRAEWECSRKVYLAKRPSRSLWRACRVDYCGMRTVECGISAKCFMRMF